MYKASVHKRTLHFHNPAGTSRGVLTDKDSWFILLSHEKQPGLTGIGECSPVPGLSPDDSKDFESKLRAVCHEINEGISPGHIQLDNFPSIGFGLETAGMDLEGGGKRILFPSEFTQEKDSIQINGLIWMGSFQEMLEQIKAKIADTYTCIKIKIGAIDLEDELELLKKIRLEFGRPDLQIRLDANGAFAPGEALEIVKRFSDYHIHSMEQPIKPGNPSEMAALCQDSPVPIALDEELIGVSGEPNQTKLLDTLHPAYLIIKPTLLGGFGRSEQWIRLAKHRNIGWWVTSALESNIGLNAIAQWTYTLNHPIHHGLGTGKIYSDNIPSPLYLISGNLYHGKDKAWETGMNSM